MGSLEAINPYIRQMDYSAAMLDPIFNSLSVAATLVCPFHVEPHEIRVVDKTAGIEVPDMQSAILTVRPAAYVRAKELTAKNIDPKDLDNAALTMNGKEWRVEAARPVPVPNGGEAAGQYEMILVEVYS